MFVAAGVTPLRRARGLDRALFAALAVTVLLATSSVGSAGTPKEGTSRLFSIAKPAVVMVQAVYHAKISVPGQASVPPSKVDELKAKLIARVQAGELSTDESALREAAFNEIINNPFEYLVPVGAPEVHDVGIVAQGSGFIVTPEGYVVTNAHVVTEDMDALKQGFAATVLSEMVKKAVNDFVAALGGEAKKEWVDKITQVAQVWYIHYMQFESLTTNYYVEVGVAVPGKQVEQKGLVAEVVSRGQPVPGKDVAILKVEGKNLPTLPVGDDTALKTGDPICAIGYPGAATFHPYLDQSASVEPTLTTGVVSARKEMSSGGYSAIQTDAAITHGNSGGPALDSSGNVIGLTTFGTVTKMATASGDTAFAEIQGMNFIVPSSVVKEFLDRANIKPHPSIVTRLFTKTVDQMGKQHYKSALKTLQQIGALSPGAPYVEEYTKDAQQEILSGKDRSWEEWLPTVIGVVLVLGVLLVLVAATAIARSRRAAPLAAYAPGQAAQAPPPALPQYPQPAQAAPPPQPAAPPPTPATPPQQPTQPQIAVQPPQVVEPPPSAQPPVAPLGGAASDTSTSPPPPTQPQQ